MIASIRNHWKKFLPALWILLFSSCHADKNYFALINPKPAVVFDYHQSSYPLLPSFSSQKKHLQKKDRNTKDDFLLRNELQTASFQSFKKTVRHQAQIFSDSFFIESPKKVKQIALTFDDGPYPHYDEKILKILKKYRAKATFFLLGKNMERFPYVVRKIQSEGHALGNHSYNHPDLRRFSKEFVYRYQVGKTQEIFENIIDLKPAIFRPPYGAITAEQIDFLSNKGIRTVNWSIDTFDWRRSSKKEIVKNVSHYAHEGAIILMHSGGGDRQRTVQALPQIIEELRLRDYTFVTIPELLQIPAYLEI